MTFTSPQPLPLERAHAERWSLAISVFAILFFACFLALPLATRVGDGSEYYALYLAERFTHLPFMTEKAWGIYAAQVSAGMPGIPLENLMSAFPALQLGNGADFNHFWLYSLVPSLIGSAVHILTGHELPPHVAFLVFHGFLFAVFVLIARRFFNIHGVIAVCVLVFLSPMFWFIDKVHTEFFTFCVIGSAVTLTLKNRYLVAAFFVSLASTQNISFAPIAFFLVLADYSSRTQPRRFSLYETGLLLLVAGFCLLHPAYYFFRFGVVTPQLLAGGAKSSPDWAMLYLWILDPDVGLLPNWPFGVALLMGAWLGRGQIKPMLASDTKAIVFLLASYLLVSLAAQSATQNLNSGATPGLARYATWYIPLFFLPTLATIRFFSQNSLSPALLTTALVSILSIAYNWSVNHPFKGEGSYNEYSPASRIIQEHFPGLYNPPSEIFAERFSGNGEGVWLSQPFAIMGPDCRKVLVMDRPGARSFIADSRFTCQVSPNLAENFIREKLRGSTALAGKDHYLTLTDADIQEIIFRPVEGKTYQFASGHAMPGILKSGWGQSESWGTWCIGKKCELDLVCPANPVDHSGLRAVISLNPFVTPAHPDVTFSVQTREQTLWSGNIIAPITLSFDFTAEHCKADQKIPLQFTVENPVSPRKLGMSGDTRTLGIALISVRYEKHN